MARSWFTFFGFTVASIADRNESSAKSQISCTNSDKNFSQAIVAAAAGNHLDILEHALRYEKANVSIMNNAALMWALKHQNEKAIVAITQHDTFKMGTNPSLLKAALKAKSVSLVKAILANPNFKLSENDFGACFKTAVKNSNIDIIILFVQDARAGSHVTTHFLGNLLEEDTITPEKKIELFSAALNNPALDADLDRFMQQAVDEKTPAEIVRMLCLSSPNVGAGPALKWACEKKDLTTFKIASMSNVFEAVQVAIEHKAVEFIEFLVKSGKFTDKLREEMKGDAEDIDPEIKALLGL